MAFVEIEEKWNNEGEPQDEGSETRASGDVLSGAEDGSGTETMDGEGDTDESMAQEEMPRVTNKERHYTEAMKKEQNELANLYFDIYHGKPGK